MKLSELQIGDVFKFAMKLSELQIGDVFKFDEDICVILDRWNPKGDIRIAGGVVVQQNDGKQFTWNFGINTSIPEVEKIGTGKLKCEIVMDEEPIEFQSLYWEYIRWIRDTFPNETWRERVNYLAEEMEELSSKSNDPAEYADVFMLLMACMDSQEIAFDWITSRDAHPVHVARMELEDAIRKLKEPGGSSPYVHLTVWYALRQLAAIANIDLIKAFRDKFEINKKRIWKKTEKGIRHE